MGFENGPRVSIGMPVYNGERYLPEALDSLLRQTFNNFEIIICDNASDDRTEEICRTYAIRDNRIRYFRNKKNMGATFNHNRTVRISDAPYFKWAASDDVHAPQFLERCVEALDADASLVLAYCRSDWIDENGAKIKENPDRLAANSKNPVERFRSLVLTEHNCNSIFGVIRREFLNKTSLMGRCVSADRIILVKLGLLGRFHEVPESLFSWRRHLESSTVTHSYYTRQGWWDVSRKGKIAFPAWRLLAEYTKAVWQSDLGPSQKAKCYSCLLNWSNIKGHRLKQDIRNFFLHLTRQDLSLYGNRKNIWSDENLK